MKEHSLTPGDTVGKWKVEEHIANGCIYSVTQKDDSDRYALKFREQGNERRFNNEIDILKTLNEGGGHPSFQKLYDYDDQELWMVLTFVDPKHNAEGRNREDVIENLDVSTFLEKYIDAFKYALDQNILLSNRDVEVFVRNGWPFFVDIEGSLHFSNRRTIKELLFEHLCCYDKTPLDRIRAIGFYEDLLDRLKS